MTLNPTQKKFRYRDHDDHQETLLEDIFNSITHGIAAAGSIAATVLMIVYGAFYGGVMAVITSSIFGASLIIMYLASTIYHALRRPSFFRIMDHVCIYLLIAGSYTPFMLGRLGGAWGWSVMSIIWVIAIAGIIFKIMGSKSSKYGLLATASYVIMGWLGVAAIVPMMDGFSTAALWLLVGGGLVYSLGVIFYLWDHLPFNHMIWHLFVMGGSACHITACFLDVTFKSA